MRIGQAYITKNVLSCQGKSCSFLISNYQEVVCFWIYLLCGSFFWVNLTNDCIQLKGEVIIRNLFSHFTEDVILDFDGLNWLIYLA